MDEDRLKALLDGVSGGRVTVAEATSQLKDLPFVELGFATLDTHRQVRSGYPEVVLGGPKTVAQLEAIVGALVDRGQPVLVTRISEEQGEALARVFPKGTYLPVPRLFHLGKTRRRSGNVVVVTAGTSDLPVAEEAAVTAEVMGVNVKRIYDVGVAGLHRLLRRRSEIAAADAAVVVAGMEGALASVVGGLVGCPVVAVPTSIGYGASLHGLSALLGMLSSCTPNVAVQNIDNGFGGGFYAALVARRRRR